MVSFSSAHAPFIKQYIEFKRSLGYRYSGIEYQFGAFDRLLADIGFTEAGLTRAVCEAWSEKRPNETDTNRYSRINIVCNYARFLNGIGYPSYLPRMPRKRGKVFTPHIYSAAELSSFFDACDALQANRRSVTAGIYPALFRLLYGCGIRISEALSLESSDIDMHSKTITIRSPKNGEDRIVPFSDSVRDALVSFDGGKGADALRSPFFFAGRHGAPCNASTAYKWFRRILFEAGISHGGRRIGPRIHDFRHTFAVHSLAAMAAAGLDIYYGLPILSKYLGHKSLDGTEAYVRLTEEMFPGIMGEMNKICAFVFPEVARL